MVAFSDESLNDVCSPLLENDESKANSDEQEDRGGDGGYIGRVLSPEFDCIGWGIEWVYNDITNRFESPSDAVFLVSNP